MLQPALWHYTLSVTTVKLSLKKFHIYGVIFNEIVISHYPSRATIYTKIQLRDYLKKIIPRNGPVKTVYTGK